MTFFFDLFGEIKSSGYRLFGSARRVWLLFCISFLKQWFGCVLFETGFGNYIWFKHEIYSIVDCINIHKKKKKKKKKVNVLGLSIKLEFDCHP
ncbi:hypothetical protein HanIR_Chr12g0579291 [Helianthus annuus]|nr:hypothetical protein HanIR_Chr12g0579291 [Helianthus annuus]